MKNSLRNTTGIKKERKRKGDLSRENGMEEAKRIERGKRKSDGCPWLLEKC